jgi:MFS family permease
MVLPSMSPIVEQAETDPKSPMIALNPIFSRDPPNTDPKSPIVELATIPLNQLGILYRPTSAPAITYRTYKRRFFGYALLLLLSLLVSWSFTAFAVVIDITADYFDTTTSTINWFATIWLFCNTIACPPAAWAMRVSAKRSLVCGAALMLASSWLKYGGTKIHNMGLAMFGQILSGFASAFICNVPPLYSNEWFSPETRATATAVGCMSNVAGGVMSALVMPVWVNDLSDVPITVLWTSVITTVVAIPVVSHILTCGDIRLTVASSSFQLRHPLHPAQPWMTSRRK